MTNQARDGMGTATTVILTLLLAIILRAALEGFIAALTAGRTLRQIFGPPGTETWLRTWQFIVFLILLARFYGGAYRFNQEQPPSLTTPMVLLNLVGTFLLFCLFYVIAADVQTLDLFYVFIFAMHVFDFVWFFLVLLALPQGSPLHQPVKMFLLFDLVTLLVFSGLFWRSWKSFLQGSDFAFQWGALSFLAAISFFDWWWLRDFYFHPEKWRAKT